MPNTLRDNTYLILDTSPTALEWPSGGARVKTVRLRMLNTTSVCVFNIVQAGTPIFMASLAIHGVGSSAQVFQTLHNFDMGGVRFHSAWIPSTLTACTAWIDFV